MQVVRPEPIGEPQTLYRFHYWDNKTVLRTFKSELEMKEFARKEGDALIKIEYLD